MKITTYFINHYDKHDWHINFLPFFNIGNSVYGKGVVINIGWIFWCWNISIIK